MQAILLRSGAKQVELADVPDPVCRDGQILIQALETGICGTDREMIQRQLVDVPPGQDYLAQVPGQSPSRAGRLSRPRRAPQCCRQSVSDCHVYTTPS